MTGRNSAKPSAAQTAAILNAKGYSPVDPHNRFTRTMVRDSLVKLGLRGEKEDDSLLSASAWWIRDLAQEVGMPWLTLRDWALKGWVHGRQTNVQKRWILWADEEEVERLQRLRSAHTHVFLAYPKELTTPKPRPLSREVRPVAKGPASRSRPTHSIAAVFELGYVERCRSVAPGTKTRRIPCEGRFANN
jgi:hypothetical protein